MSRQTDAMDFILGLLKDGILTIADENRVIAASDSSKITNVPYAQAFEIAQTNSDEDPQSAGTFTFELQIFLQTGNKDVLRTAIEALDSTLRIDESWQGLVEKGMIVASAVAERTDPIRSMASVTFEVVFKESHVRPEFVALGRFNNLFNFAPVNCEVEVSKRVRVGLGVRRAIASNADLIVNYKEGSAFPADLTDVQRLRVFFYLTPEYSSVLFDMSLGVFDDALNTVGSLFAEEDSLFIRGSGWREIRFDIRGTPTSTIGGGWGGTEVNAFRFQWNMFFNSAFTSDSFGLIFLSLGYHPRDVGTLPSGVHPGF